MPDTRLIRENFAYYLWNGPRLGGQLVARHRRCRLLAAAAGARSPTTTRSQRLWWFRIAAASCLVWLLPLSFFLTHGVKNAELHDTQRFRSGRVAWVWCVRS